MEFTGCFLWAYFQKLLEQDIPRIEAFVHIHHSHSRGGIPRQDCRVDRRCAAMAGQERGVEIEAAEGWQLQDGLR